MVRELTHYRCASDPFKGDMPWKRVQQHAREAMDALHSAPAAETGGATAFGVAKLEGRIQGFGSDSDPKSSSSYYQGYGGSSGKKMTGFGGAPLEASNNQQSMLEAFTTGIKGFTDRAMETIMRPQHQRLASYDSEENRGLYENPRTFLPPSFPPESGLVSESNDQPPNPQTHSNLEDTFGQNSSSTKSKEEKLVNLSCNVSSLRVVPSTSEVRRFLQDTRSYCDGTLLAQALQHKLVSYLVGMVVLSYRDLSFFPFLGWFSPNLLFSHLQDVGSWQETLRALYFVEALLDGDKEPDGTVTNSVFSFFNHSPETIFRASQSTQSTVRQRAERVLRLLGKASTSGPLHTEASLPVPSAKPTQDLLATSPGEEKAELHDLTASNAMDLLAELDDSQQGLDKLNLDAPASSGVPATRGGDDLDDMLFGDWTAPQPTGEINTEKPSLAQSVKELDLLDGGGFGLAAASVPCTRNASSMQQQDSWSVLLGGVEPAAFKSPSSSLPHSTVSTARSTQPTLQLGSTLSHSTHDNGVQGARNAAASGINSSKRQDLAFNFVQGTMAELKSKK
jgi:hypothetical protein